MCEGEQFVNVRGFVTQKFKFLSGRRESIENIFIGILGSSIVTLIGYISDYFQSLKNLQKDVKLCYMDMRYELFPYIGGNNVEIIYNVRRNDTMIKMGEIACEYKKVLDFYSSLLKHINKLWKDDIYKFELLNFTICSKYVKAAFVITAVYNHFIILHRNLLCERICLSTYKEGYKTVKNIVEKKELIERLKFWKQQYKAFKQSDKNMIEYIESLKLNERCRNLDTCFGLTIWAEEEFK